MAEESVNDVRNLESPEKHPRLQLDTMSKEELVMQAKKQLMLLHKTKLKCDELTTKNSNMEMQLTDKEAELSDLKEKYEAAVSSYAAEKKVVCQELRDLQERLECMQMKQETANTTFDCLREEIANLETENKALKDTLVVQQEARDESIMSLETMKETLKEKHEEELADLSGKLTKARLEDDQLSSVVQCLQRELAVNRLTIDSLETEKRAAIESLSNRNKILEDEACALRTEKEKLVQEWGGMAKLGLSGDDIEAMMSRHSDTIEELRERAMELEDLSSSEKSLRSKCSELEAELCDLKAGNEKWLEDERTVGILRETCDQLARHLDEMSMGKVQSEEALNMLKLKYDATVSQSGETKAELETLRTENEDLRRQILRLQAPVTEADERESKTLLEALKELRSSEEGWKERYEGLESAHECCLAELHDLQSRKPEWQRSLEQTRQMIASLEGELHEARMSEQRLQSMVTSERENASKLQDELQETRSSLEQDSEQRKWAEEENQVVIDQLRTSVQRSECELGQLQTEKELLEETVGEKDVELQSASKKISELENARLELKEEIVKLILTLKSNEGDDTELTDVTLLDAVQLVQECVKIVHSLRELDKLKNTIGVVLEGNKGMECKVVGLCKLCSQLEATAADLEARVTLLEASASVECCSVGCQVGDERPSLVDVYVGCDVQVADASTDTTTDVEESSTSDSSSCPNRQQIVERLSECEKERRQTKDEFDAKISQCLVSAAAIRGEVVSICSAFNDILEFLRMTELDPEFKEYFTKLFEGVCNWVERCKAAGFGEVPSENFDRFVVERDCTVRNLEWLKDFVGALSATIHKWHETHEGKSGCGVKVGRKQLLGKDVEEMLSKYKIVAVKAKKETSEMKAKIESLNQEMSALSKEKCLLEENLRMVSSQLNEERQRHRQTTSKLEQHGNLMSLEMADYERHANDLSRQLAERDAVVGNLENDIALQLEKIHGLQLQIEQLENQNRCSEERGEQLKSVSVRLRKEIADFQNAELQWKASEAALRSQLESTSQELENAKVHLSDAVANNRKLLASNQSTSEANQKVVRLLEGRIGALAAESDKLQSEYKNCQLEYENYKIRVHTVLKEQKSKSATGVGSSASQRACVPDVSSEEKAELESIIESLQTKIYETSVQCAAVKTENESLQEEYCNLLQRHNKLVANLADQEVSWRQRLEKLQLELKSEQQDSSELVRQLRMQLEATEVGRGRQLAAIEEEHQHEVRKLQEQLGAAEAQCLKLQRADVSRTSPVAVACRDEDPAVDVFTTERQEGEGSDFTDSLYSTGQKLQLASPTSSFIPLEQLLNEDIEKNSTSSAMTFELEKLEGQLAISSKKLEHLTEILHESEATNARMTEQNRVLKEEIRRLERNQEREKHLANMEYLKNILVKFLLLNGGDERERLVPVLSTLLRLSPDEEQQIASIAKGGAVEHSGAGASWSSYLTLPRWPGI